jgi:hypothetical protein
VFIPTINVIRTFEELIDSPYFLEKEELLSLGLGCLCTKKCINMYAFMY